MQTKKKSSTKEQGKATISDGAKTEKVSKDQCEPKADNDLKRESKPASSVTLQVDNLGEAAEGTI